jgi:hypothetical protein
MTTHFNSIVKTNADAKDPFAGLPIGNDGRQTRYYNDFIFGQDYAAADWTITTTEAGAGSATEALATDEDNGALLITNDDADNDMDQLQQVQETWVIASGRKAGFAAKFKVSDADNVDMILGLCITDTSLIAGLSDGVYFNIADGSTDLTLVAEKDSTATTLTSVATMADDTYVEVGFHYDGNSTITAFTRDSDTDGWGKKGTITTNLPDNENLCISIALQNGEAAAKSMTIDYIDVRQERS